MLGAERACDIAEFLKTGLNKEQSVSRKVLSPLLLISALVLELACGPVVEQQSLSLKIGLMLEALWAVVIILW